MPVAFSYVRFSTSQQQEGASLDRQEQMARRWASANGYDLDEQHRDLGKSAYKGTHRKEGALSKFLYEMEHGRIPRDAALLIEAIDRLTRECFNDAMGMFIKIMNGGVKIITLEDGVEYSAAEMQKNPFLPNMLLAKIQGAHAYSQRLSGLVNDGKTRARNAKLASKKPITRMCPSWLRVEQTDMGTAYIPIPERVAVIQTIFEDLNAGTSKEAITRRLNERGVAIFDRAGQGLTAKNQTNSGRWYVTTVSRLSKNRALIGEFQPSTKNAASEQRRTFHGEPVPDLYPVVISPSLFDRVQRVHKPAGRRGVGFANLLQGIARCAQCGSPMLHMKKGERWPDIKRKNGKPLIDYQYYVCTAAKKRFVRDGKPVCNNMGVVNYREVEASIVSMATLLVEIEVYATQSDQVRAIADRLAENSTLVADAEKRLSNLADEFGRNPSSTMAKIISRLDGEIGSLHTSRKLLEAKRRKIQPHKGQGYTELSNMVKQANANSNEQERGALRAQAHAILKNCIDNLVINGSKKMIAVWLGGGRLLCSVAEELCMTTGKYIPMQTNYVIMGTRMLIMTQYGDNFERETPADIYAEHLRIVGGSRLTPEEARQPLPGIFRGSQIVMGLADGTEVSRPAVDVLRKNGIES